jgi:hypothetical protein
MMIVSQVIGGLGNQMFQYAAGRAVSLRSDTMLALDISNFNNYALHQGFELLRIFLCPVIIASEIDLKNILGWQQQALIRRLLMHPTLSKLRTNKFIVEPHFHYWADIHQVPKNAYLTGYWQSEKYFSHIAETIRADFTFSIPLSEKNEQLAKQISQVNAVSLHVRRGDYVQNPITTATHGVCTLDYYQAAIQSIACSVAEPYFFIFSDDIAWVKANLKMTFPCQFIEHNQEMESYNDMRLMSLCQHHIIANSSFSWWGAWLNPSTDKIVIAPQKWFANKNDVKDLIPSGWITL